MKIFQAEWIPLKVELNEKEKETLKSWQVGDLLLYNHFQQIFKQKIIDYGDTKMKEDIIYCKN